MTPPPPPATHIARARLDALIRERVMTHAATVIAAPAGSGKTTAVRDALVGDEVPVAWLSLDRTDAAPGRLLVYLESAVREAAPGLAAVATEALGEGIAHPEAAGLLAEAVPGPLVLVLDDLERLGDEAQAWNTVEAFVRYSPPGLHTVLLCRRDIPPSLCVLPASPGTAVIRDPELAFTIEEIGEALAAMRIEAEPAEVMEFTQGWATGVLFHESGDVPFAAGGGDGGDPLHGWLSRQLLDRLAPGTAEFLITTALLGEVDERGAVALAGVTAGRHLAALRDARLPVTWTADQRAIRCHPRFREFLLDRLHERGAEPVAALRRRHAALLAEEGYFEDATEELLRAGDHQAALAMADHAILDVVERLDFSVAERWLAALGPRAGSPASTLDIAELMLAIAHGDFRRGVRLGDRLAAAGQRGALASRSEQAALLLGWCYSGVWRLDELMAVVRAADPSPAMDALLYTEHIVVARSTRARPKLTGGPTDPLVLHVDLARGHVNELSAAIESPWGDAVASPARISALRAAGRTQEALELYEQARREGVAEPQLESLVAPELLMDLGRHAEALEVLLRARRLCAANGAMWGWFSTWLAEAKLRLRHHRDIAGGLGALDNVARELHATGLRVSHVEEVTAMWRGFALLLGSDGSGARPHLESAVSGMVEGGRGLEIPTAAVYLSEARWRDGDEEGADAAADLALAAAHRQRSNHLLLQALADFPAVASRRLDALTDPESQWHEIGRALFALRPAEPLWTRPDAVLHDLGRPEIEVGGRPCHPRIAKALELLAYLLTRPSRCGSREELLGALFEGRADPSARAYLRQAISELRKVLPPDTLQIGSADIGLASELTVATASGRFEALLVESRSRLGAERLERIREALELCDRGPYLLGSDSTWAQERQRRLGELAIDARHDAAELAFQASAYGSAHELIECVLGLDPTRERAWRLKMRIAGMLGDGDGVIRAFRDCREALGAIGVEPGPPTRALLTQLRA